MTATAAGVVIFVASLVAGIVVFIAAIFVLVFTLYRRAAARARAALAAEGIVLDSGPRTITIRYTGFRARGFYRGVGYTKTRASIVLTRRRFAVTPARRQFYSVDRAELGRYTVGIAGDGTLNFHSDDPPHASGSIDYRVEVPDAAAWVRALTDAGMRPIR